MIVIQARIPVNSERRNTAYEHIHAFVDASRAEDGCLRCDAFMSLEDPDSILIHQTWRDGPDLDRHASGAALDAFLTVLPQFVDGQVVTTRYETVASASGDDAAMADDAAMEADMAGAESGAPRGVTVH